MTRTRAFLTLFIFCHLFFPIATCLASEGAQVESQADILVVSGTITNDQGKPVKEVTLHFFFDDKKVEPEEEVITSPGGQYEAEIRLPSAPPAQTDVEMEASKPSYKSSGRLKLEHVVEEKTGPQGNHYYLAHHSFVLKRAVTPAFWISTIILIAVYALIALELLHRTLAAFLGASLLLTLSYTAGTFAPDYFILSYEDAIEAIDMNVIFLLMGMMMIVGILKKTGLFQWMAYKSYQAARGNIYALATILMVVTAVASAFLDNVTTMLLIIPVTIEIALTLRINPIALLMPEVFASNVGGTATLIGDPPNIMIGSYAKLSFLDFVQNLSAVCAVGMVITVVYFLLWYRKEYAEARVGNVQETIDHLRAEYKITDKTLLIQGSILLGLTIFLFIMHGALKMEPSIAALLGAAVLMAISRVNIVEMLEKEVEWPTLIFFMMLFVVVAGAEETGVIQTVADWVRDMSQGSMVAAILMVVWVAAVASAIVDNIPFTATMLPIVSYLTGAIPGAENGILWWALALGACLGGNGTMIGASANVVTVGMAERAGYHISFMEYVKVAAVPTLITIVLASAWMLLLVW
jgi:Na+/H+ antiporter NhaD/arsenite permease-like protein